MSKVCSSSFTVYPRKLDSFTKILNKDFNVVFRMFYFQSVFHHPKPNPKHYIVMSSSCWALLETAIVRYIQYSLSLPILHVIYLLLLCFRRKVVAKAKAKGVSHQHVKTLNILQHFTEVHVSELWNNFIPSTVKTYLMSS